MKIRVLVTKAYSVIRQAEIVVECTDAVDASKLAFRTPDDDPRWSTTWRLQSQETEYAHDWIAKVTE